MLLTLLEMTTVIVILGLLGFQLIWGPRVPAKRTHSPGQPVKTRRGRTILAKFTLLRRSGRLLRKGNSQRRPTAVTRSVKVPAA